MFIATFWIETQSTWKLDYYLLSMKSLVTETLLEMERKGIVWRTTFSGWVFFKLGYNNYPCRYLKRTKSPKYVLMTRLQFIQRYSMTNSLYPISKSWGKYLCKFDIQCAYLHLPLDEESRNILTIAAITFSFTLYAINRSLCKLSRHLHPPVSFLGRRYQQHICRTLIL